jgi:hypothetical protein
MCYLAESTAIFALQVSYVPLKRNLFVVAWSPSATGHQERTLWFHVFHNTLWTPLKRKIIPI